MESILAGNPSEHLEGVELEGGWTVTEKLVVGKALTDGTGANFTVAYKVRHADGTEAFLKAMDYSRAMKSPDRTFLLNQMTSAYIFEREVLKHCRKQRMDRVVKALADGSVEIDKPEAKGAADYIIFELADADVRGHLQSFSEQFDLAWKLRSLHHIATGLKQLHSHQIAHQDLKPSNVLVFDGKVSKLADLGRSARRGIESQFDNWDVPGDRTYAPLDLAYGFILPDWTRRVSGDAYHLGSMVVFFFCGVSMTSLTLDKLDSNLRPWPGPWTGSFEEVLPYLRVAFDEAIEEFASQIIDGHLSNDLTQIVRQLCEPDPQLRGHPLERRPDGNSFSLVRYIEKFNVLAHRAEAGFFRRSN